MTSFLDGLNINDAKELKTLPTGTECELRIAASEVKEGEKGRYWGIRLEVMGDLYTKDISHVMMFPRSQDDPKRANNRRLAIQRFCEAFGITYVKIEKPEDAIGLSSWALLREVDDEEYGMQNRVRRWLGVSKFPNVVSSSIPTAKGGVVPGDDEVPF